jgi:mycofactocin precursor
VVSGGRPPSADPGRRRGGLTTHQDPPFRFGTRCHILATSVTFVETHVTGRTKTMEPNQQVETEAELVTESLVEEVSIDGMCGVY